MEFFDLLQALRAQSIADLLSPDEASVWRQYCRNYSKTFHTPLHVVEDLDPEAVLLAVLENNLEPAGGDNIDDNIDELLERIYSIEDPEYESLKKAELDEIDKQIEEDEAERLRLKKPIHSALKNTVFHEKTLLDPEKPKVENKPPGGSINLSYLSEQDSEGGGFEG